MMFRHKVLRSVLGLLLPAVAVANGARIEIHTVTMDIIRAPGSTYPEVRGIPSATGGKALVWGAFANECHGASAATRIAAEQAPAGSYTLWLRQSYSDRGAVSGFTGIEIDMAGKTFKNISGPRGELYYTTSLEKFYWTPVPIGVFHGGAIKITRDASGGGNVATDVMVLTDDARWRPEGYKPAGQFPKTIAGFAGPAMDLPEAGKGNNDVIIHEAETLMINRAGMRGMPTVERGADRWGRASGGAVVVFNCIIDQDEAKKSVTAIFPQLPKNNWRLWIRLAHGLPEKDRVSYPPPVEDTGLYIIVGGQKTMGPLLRPSTSKEWNEFFWRSVDLADFTGGKVEFVRRTGGGWLMMDLVILSSRQDYNPIEN